MLLTTLYFLLALLLLVLVHEYGHFQVARWCGVKVLRFSFGFGPILARWRDKKGCEYAWSLIPMGGYIKMLGENDSEVPQNEQAKSFFHKPLYQRIAIVLAGPFFNFLFAFIALWLVLVIGMQSLAPMIASVKPGSLADKAGFTKNQEIISINDMPVTSWQNFQYRMMPFIGSKEDLVFKVKAIPNGRVSQLSLPLEDWKLDDNKPDLLKSLGIKPFIPKIPPIIGEIVPNSPAAKSTLRAGDYLHKVNGEAITDWLFLVNYVKAHPDTSLNLDIKRTGTLQQIRLMSGHVKDKNTTEGFLGLKSQKVNWPAHWLRLEKKGPVEALGLALKQTIQLTVTTFTLMGRLVTGQLGLKTISGPLGIAQGAGNSGRNGLVSYLFFLALVSISLAVLNLLPIPLLDGGHLLYYIVEFFRGEPLSERVKSIGVYFGLLLLGALMCIALTNDISRL